MKDLADNDLYKFTMQNAVLKLFPDAEVQYTFINRGGTEFPDGFGDKLREYVDGSTEARITPIQKEHMAKSNPYFDSDYLDYLEAYRYNPDEVSISQESGKLLVDISGKWASSILWEVPLMGLISELYFGFPNLFHPYGFAPFPTVSEGKDINKALKLKELGVKFMEFGTRRRHSCMNQRRIVRILEDHVDSEFFMGTSNVSIAGNFGLGCYGTQAHEWFMAMAAIYGFEKANEMALENWIKVYGNDLAIALTDTYTTDNFFSVFGKYASHFDGVRHDSGDAIEFAQKVIVFYKENGIDPLSKMVVFSDGLNYEEIRRIDSYCKGKIKYCFGVGTNFTNDIDGVNPLNIVIKMTKFRVNQESPWVGTVKLSDVEGKHTGNIADIEKCKKELGIYRYN
jgi:nicotinate phosphoribosyltransferase